MTRQKLLGLLALIVALTAWGQSEPPGTAVHHVWVEPGPSREGASATIHVNCDPHQSADKPVAFKCDLHASHPIDDATLGLEVKDPLGNKIYEDKVGIQIDKNGAVCQMEWDAGRVPAGDYTATLVLFQVSGFEVTRRDFCVRKVSPAELRSTFERVQPQIAALTERLAAMQAQGGGAPYARMRVAIAQRYLPEVRKALEEENWPWADTCLRYVCKVAERVPAFLALGGSTSEFWDPVPRPSLRTLEVGDGGFRAEGHPVFLLGANLGLDGSVDHARFAAAAGLNLGTLAVGPSVTMAGPDQEADFRAKLDPVFQAAEQENLALAVCLAPDEFGDWAAQLPGVVSEDTKRVDVTQPAAVAVIERHIRALAPYLAKQPSVRAIFLAQNPAFRFTGEKIRRRFLDVVKAEYANRDEVNRAWRGLFADLDEIQIGWNRVSPRYQDSSAYRYDWQMFHQQLGAEYLQWLRQVTRDVAPGPSLAVAFSDNVLDKDEGQAGIDREASAALFEVTGCCAANPHLDVHYALGYPQEPLIYTLMRSFAPEKPVMNFDDRILDDTDPSENPCTFAYVHALMWEAAMAGLNGSALRLDTTRMRPECIEGYTTACLDLNRLAPIVAAFQRAPAEVAILWSMPSKIYSEGSPYLDSVRYAYEGCSFGGHKLRFITEKQCVAGDLKDLRVLVVPDTPAVADETFPVLKEYMQGSGIVVRTSSSILFDEHGHTRRDLISATRRTVLVRGLNLPTEYLHAMDAVAALGQLPPIPRTVNTSGYPVEGVKTLYLETDGQPYLYVVNLRKEPTLCHLYGGDRAGRDLIGARDVSFPARLEPLDPMLIRLDKQVPEVKTAKKKQEHPK